MMSNKQSRIDDFEDGFETVCGSIGYWLTGGEVAGKTIATGKEPPLKVVARAAGYDWTPMAQSVFDQLREDGLLRTEWVCRRKVKWIPTEDLRTDIQRFTDKQLPRGSFLQIKGRKTALHQLKNHPVVRETVERPSDTKGNLIGLDAAAITEKGDWLIQVFDESDPSHWWEDLYNRCSRYHCQVLWVFDHRETMVNFANHLHGVEDCGIELTNGGLAGEAKNWSAGNVSERLVEPDGDRQHHCFTLTSLIEEKPIQNFRF